MKVKSLEYFIALAEARSINKAAQKMYIAQPSLTKALQLLEKEIGVLLFVRNKSGIELTEAGEKILPEARQIVAFYNGWMTLSEERSLQNVDIYAHASFPNFLLPDVIMQIKKMYPELSVNCEVTFAPELHISQDIRRPVLTMFPCAAGENYQSLVKRQGNRPLVLFQGEYGCLVNKNSPLAEKAGVTLEDLKTLYFVQPELKELSGCGISFLTPILCDIIEIITPRQVIQVESVESVIKLVKNHPEAYALSYYPALNRYEGVVSGKLVYVPFLDQNTKGDLCLFYSKRAYQQYPAMQELVKAIQTAAEQFLSQMGTPGQG